MSGNVRIALYLSSALLFGLQLILALSGLPSFGEYRGPYGDLIMQAIIDLRHTPQGVAAVTFDFRGFDTLGEEFILFTAVAGALLLMRQQRGELKQRPVDQAAGRRVPPVTDAVHATGMLMFPFTLLLGIYIVLHGHLSPGGGFQGGVLLASAFYFVYLSGEYRDLAVYSAEHTLDVLEAAGAAGFALVAFLPWVMHEPFMQNILPLGRTGELLSAGNLPLYNCAVGLEVGAAFLLLIAAFLRQVLVIRKGKVR